MAKTPKTYAPLVLRDEAANYTDNNAPLSHAQMDDNWIALDTFRELGKHYSGILSENFAIDITVGGLFIDNPRNNGATDEFVSPYVDYRHDSAKVKTRAGAMPSEEDSAFDLTIVEGTINSYKGDIKLRNGRIEYGTAGQYPTNTNAGNFVQGTQYKITTLNGTSNLEWNAAAGTTSQPYAIGTIFTAQTAGAGEGKAASLPLAPEQGLGLAFYDMQDVLSSETMRLGTKKDLLIGTTANPDMGVSGTNYSKFRVVESDATDVLIQFGSSATAAAGRETFLQLGSAGPTKANSNSPGIKATQNTAAEGNWNLSLTSYDYAATTPAYINALTVAPDGIVTFAKPVGFTNATQTYQTVDPYAETAPIIPAGLTAQRATITGPIELGAKDDSDPQVQRTIGKTTIKGDLEILGSLAVSGTGTGSVTSVALDVPTDFGLAVSNSPVTSAGTINLSYATGYSIPTDAEQLVWDGMVPKTGGLMTGELRVDEISNATGSQTVINGGDSRVVTKVQTDEKIYLNSEGGVEISSSSDNWGQASASTQAESWTNRLRTTIDASGITTFSALDASSTQMTPAGFIGDLQGNASSATDATKIQVNGGVNYWAATTAGTASKIAARDGNGDIYASRFRGALTGNVTGDVSGNISGSTGDFTGNTKISGTLSVINIQTVQGDLNIGLGTQLTINAGESMQYATEQTAEKVYLNAEGGIEISSSPDNWATGWATKKTTTINAGGIVTDGVVTAGGLVKSVTVNPGFEGNLDGNASTATTAGTATDATKLGGLLPSSADSDSTIVKRDANGNFAASVITAAEFSGPATNTTSERSKYEWIDAAKTVRGVQLNVVGHLSWNWHGNNHTVFDASGKYLPDGETIFPGYDSDAAQIGVNNPQNSVNLDGTNGFRAATLMGTNGTNTYGVKVNYAQIATECLLVTGNARADGVARWHDTVFKIGKPAFIAGGVGGSTSELKVYGPGVFSKDVTAFSDRTIKKNIISIPNALDKVCAIGGYTFDRTDVECKRSTGVIAQEVLEVLPEAVHQDEDGIYSVAYGNMVGLLIEAIKELREEVAELRGNV